MHGILSIISGCGIHLKNIRAWVLTPSRQFAQDVAAVANTQVDWLETPDAHVFKVNLPGLRKEEIKVQVVDNNVLQISGARKKENVEQTDRWHRVERASGSFFRSFRLPAHAQVNDLKAQVENGVLTINVPKLPQPTSANVKSITIS
ncbi:hypothetical protein O6H91_Y185000 [Diphasiastrum complanatum]|nr:hypothetical protein O6H91_Y185000 [Diphasiastrum complanatum]